MKLLKITIAALVIANVCMAAALPTLEQRADTIAPELKGGGVQPVKRECYQGGKGAIECYIPAGVKFSEGTSGGCTVSCDSAFYACCNYYCECRPYPKPGQVKNKDK